MNGTIQKYWIQCKRVLGRISENEDMFIFVVIILTSIASFGLGRLSVPAYETSVPHIEVAQGLATVSTANSGTADKNPVDILTPGGYYVASSKGTKYHLPWCAGANKISDTNKIIFKTKEEAEGAGYSPAGNCKGI